MKRVIIINMTDHVFTLKVLLNGVPFDVTKVLNETDNLYYKAIYEIANSIMLDKLNWVDQLEKNHVNEQLAKNVVETLQLTAGKNHQQDLIDYIDEVISEYLYSGISRMLSIAFKTGLYNHWDMKHVGKNLILKSGGIMIDLDRLNQKSGIVEIDLEDHWKATSATEQQDSQ